MILANEFSTTRVHARVFARALNSDYEYVRRISFFHICNIPTTISLG